MREGIQQGKTMPAIILRGAADQIRAQIVDKPTDSPAVQSVHKA